MPGPLTRTAPGATLQAFAAWHETRRSQADGLSQLHLDPGVGSKPENAGAASAGMDFSFA